jgi:hypothetical protein
MPTLGYTIAQSPLTIDGITLLDSSPPRCQLDFHTFVYWDGHTFDVKHQIDESYIKVYVTLNVPEPGAREGTPLVGSVDLGTLDPGRYIVTFYFRRNKQGCTEEFQPVNAVVLVAQGETGSLIKPEDSSDWYAWVNTMPPRPHTLHVMGNVIVPNSNTVVNLVKAVPQGINPKILLLEVEVDLASGGDIDKQQKVHYSETTSIGTYDFVQIRFPNGASLTIDNIDIVS